MAAEKNSPVKTGRAVLDAAGKDNVGLVAAGVAFYGFLAFVPLIAALVLGYGLFAEPETVSQHVDALFQVLPESAASIISDQLRSVSEADDGRTGFGLILAILTAIWGATKGAKAIIIALNIVYDIEEKRSFIAMNALAAVITVAIVVALVAGIAAIGALGYIESLLPGLPPTLLFLVRLAFWICAGGLAALGLALIYRFAPHRVSPSWKTLFPGAAIATALWLLATLAFGLYVANFGSYNATYGALGAVVVMLMWLYLSAYVLLLGAELNAVRNRPQPPPEVDARSG